MGHLPLWSALLAKWWQSKGRAPIWLTSAALNLAVLAGCTLGGGTSSSTAEVMTLERYAALRHDLPYVLRACRGRGSLHYVGVRHTRDSASESVRAVADVLVRTSPDALFVEGPVFAPKATLAASVEAYGEAGAALYMSDQRGLAVHSLDLPLNEEAAEVIAKFGEDRAVTFYGLRIVAQELGRDAGKDPELLLRERVIPWLQRNGMLAGRVEPMLAFRSSVSRSLGRDVQWRTVPSTWFDPLTLPGGTTNEIARFLLKLRDRRFAETLATQVRLGRKVVAVAGASHVVMQEAAILSRLGCTAVKDSEFRSSPSEHSCDSTCRADAG